VSKRKQQTAVTGLHSVGDKWKTGVELGGGTMTLFRGSMGIMGTDGLYYTMPSTAPDEDQQWLKVANTKILLRIQVIL
jgi:hypothetical protein